MVRIAGVDADALVLLEPAVESVEVEDRVAVEVRVVRQEGDVGAVRAVPDRPAGRPSAVWTEKGMDGSSTGRPCSAGSLITKPTSGSPLTGASGSSSPRMSATGTAYDGTSRRGS